MNAAREDVCQRSVAGRNAEQCVTIGRGARDLRGRQRRAGAGPRIDHHRLSKPRSHRFRDDADDAVDGAAGRQAVHHGDRAVRPAGLRRGGHRARNGARNGAHG